MIGSRFNRRYLFIVSIDLIMMSNPSKMTLFFKLLTIKKIKIKRIGRMFNRNLFFFDSSNNNNTMNFD
jgi:hypothetical protein